MIWCCHKTGHNPNNLAPSSYHQRYQWVSFSLLSWLLYIPPDDVIKWKKNPRYWPFVWGIHQSPVNSPHKGQWCGTLMFSLICAWINGSVNSRDTRDSRRQWRLHHYRIHGFKTMCLPRAIYRRRLQDQRLGVLFIATLVPLTHDKTVSRIFSI